MRDERRRPDSQWKGICLPQGDRRIRMVKELALLDFIPVLLDYRPICSFLLHYPAAQTRHQNMQMPFTLLLFDASEPCYSSPSTTRPLLFHRVLHFCVPVWRASASIMQSTTNDISGAQREQNKGTTGRRIKLKTTKPRPCLPQDIVGMRHADMDSGMAQTHGIIT